MRRFRFLLAAALVSLVVGACSSPTAPYPTPDETGEPDPKPNPGFVQPNG